LQKNLKVSYSANSISENKGYKIIDYNVSTTNDKLFGLSKENKNLFGTPRKGSKAG
jgi:hypothetical protein